MSTYSIDVKIAATMYIEADTQEEAIAKLSDLALSEVWLHDVQDLPGARLSSMATLYGAFDPDDRPDLEIDGPR